MTIRFPRLNFTSSQANPFEELARPPFSKRTLRVCLHTRGLRQLDADQQLIIRELAAPYPRRTLEVFRTPGDVPTEWATVPELAIVMREGRNRADVSLEHRGATRSGSVQLRDDVLSLASTLLRDFGSRDEVVDVLAAGGFGADLIVTTRTDLSALKDRLFEFRHLNIVSPHEAFPIVGVWSRAVGEMFLNGPILVGDRYSWIMAHAIAPAAWPGYAAILAGSLVWPRGEELLELADSLRSRLDRLVDLLDELAVAWEAQQGQRPLDYLDDVTLGTWALQDNLALLAGIYLGVSLPKPHMWGLLNSEWQKAVAKGGERGVRLVEHIEENKPRIELSQALRHHLIHRSLVRESRRQIGSDPVERRAVLTEDLASGMVERLAQMGESVESWGLTEERSLQALTASGHADLRSRVGEEAYERMTRRFGLLDPFPFGVRLVAHAARLTNDCFRILDVLSDSRLSEGEREAARRLPESMAEEWTFSPLVARLSILSSPLSGLVGLP